MEIKDRLKKIRLDNNLNQSEFARRIGIGQAGLSALEKGIRNLTDRTILDICREFKVNEVWLRTGKGKMFIPEPTNELDQLAARYNLSDLAKRVVEEFVKLDKAQSDAVMEWLKRIFVEADGETAATYEKIIDYSVFQNVAEEVREYVAQYDVQLIGRVAGGYPILAHEDKGAYLHTSVKADFALQLVGDSMEPDYPNLCYLLVKKDCDVIDGDIVVVSILRAAEIAESTCKRIYMRGDSIELHPINSVYPIQIYKSEEIKIDGKVVGKIRVK